MVLGAGPKLNSLSWVGPVEPLVLVPASPPSLQHPINSTQTASDVPDSSAEGSAWTLITQEMQPWNGIRLRGLELAVVPQLAWSDVLRHRQHVGTLRNKLGVQRT